MIGANTAIPHLGFAMLAPLHPEGTTVKLEDGRDPRTGALVQAGPPPIRNQADYQAGMARSLIDKLHFLDKVEAGLFIDFGCADGALLGMLRLVCPGCDAVGYDQDHSMIAAARKNHPALAFTADWGEVVERMERVHSEGRPTCLILSSVLHEVYHYGPAAVGEFWNRVLGLRPSHIALRDMCVSRTASRPADPVSVAKVRQRFDAGKIAQWESAWGALDENWSLTHFFLTYRYQDNWEREYKENYLPIHKEELLGKFPPCYEPVLIEHYTLPFLRARVREDFGVDLQERTHLKLIFTRPDAKRCPVEA